LVSACTSADITEAPVARLNAPPVEVVLSDRCGNVAGTYVNEGIPLGSGNVVQHPRLAHSFFRMALVKDGQERRPPIVQLGIEPGETTLLVTLVGDDAIREWSTDFECEDGWLHVRDYQGEQYLVDGVTQKWAKKDVFLALGVDGNLVSHVVGEFEDRI